MNQTRRIPAQDRLTDVGNVVTVETLAAAAKDGANSSARAFRLTGYTGAPVRRWYGQLVIDLAGMDTPKKLPALMDHDPAKRVGFSDGGIDKSEKSLQITGNVLANEYGNAFAAESAQGFPFQASVGVEFLRVEEIKVGDEKKVNGRLVSGPCVIATKSRLREISILACGADSDTSAEAFSRDTKETIEVMSELKNDSTNPAPAPAPAPTSTKIDFAAIKAAVGNRADLALQAIEAGLSPDQARGLLADALAAENVELRKQIAAHGSKPGAGSAPARVEVVPFGGASRENGNAPAAAPVGLAALAPDVITDLEPAAVETLAADVLAKDKTLRTEFRGKAADLGAYARMAAQDRVSIYEPRHGQFGAVDFALKGEGA